MSKRDINLAIPSYSGASIPAPSSDRSPDYPTLHLEGKDELDLPEEGIITFRYCLKSENRTKTEGGGERYSCTLEIKNLVSVKKTADERPSKRDTSTEDNLDRLMKEKEKESGDDDDY